MHRILAIKMSAQIETCLPPSVIMLRFIQIGNAVSDFSPLRPLLQTHFSLPTLGNRQLWAIPLKNIGRFVAGGGFRNTSAIIVRGNRSFNIR